MSALLKLHQYIIKSFLPHFLATFLVSWFVFIVQFFWLYIDDLVGKGLNASIIIKLIAYVAPTVIPFALPLGILLAGIMTYGNLAERSELTAIKSSGISLLRFSRPIIAFVLLITVGTFLIYNYVIPICNLKFYTLLMDVTNAKPAVNIKPGIFYKEIPGFTIYINKKDADNTTIRDIMIYDHTSGKGNDKVILAEKGTMKVSKDKKNLIFSLSNGTRYEERIGKEPTDKEQLRLHFTSWNKVFDLSSFILKKSDEAYLKNSEKMMTNREVRHRIDSLKIFRGKLQQDNIKSLSPYFSYLGLDTQGNKKFLQANIKNDKKNKNTVDYFPDSLHQKVFDIAKNNIRSMTSLSQIYRNDNSIYKTNAAKLQVEWHRKIAQAANVLILFLIAIPLGAIIRKGGFGAPFVAAVIFFVVYYVSIINFQKMSEQFVLSPLLGMWIPDFFFLAIAAFLFFHANKDSDFFKKDYIKIMTNYFTKNK